MDYHYRFNTIAAKNTPIDRLFRLALILIEVQRKANMFRAGIVVPDLLNEGICFNVTEVMPVGVALSKLFFKGAAYPIWPYYDNYQNPGSKAGYWGHNVTGNKRMALLDRMIKDLIHYLTHHAV
jgi:hypothetical protein